MNPPVLHGLFPRPVLTVMIDEDAVAEPLACSPEKGLITLMENFRECESITKLLPAVQECVDFFERRVLMPIHASAQLSRMTMMRVCASRVIISAAGGGLIHGVIFLRAAPGDKIAFFNEMPPSMADLETVSSNEFNAPEFEMQVESGQAVLFSPHTPCEIIANSDRDEDMVVVFLTASAHGLRH